ncbi:MAG: DUF721 domain-containing protein [Pirellulaceae bacterium]|nr:DUF721 domain-containing protein [Pirellulaceae bacterium]
MPPQNDDDRDLLNDYRRKQVRLPPPKAMGDVLSQLLARKGYAQVQAAAMSLAAWNEAAGAKLAPQTRPGNVKRGVLEVLVSNSAVHQELAFIKVKIVKTLARLAPEHKIRDLKFRVGPLD